MTKTINIRKTALIAILSLSLGSCKDVLDTQPYDKIGEDIIWSNRANAETFIYNTYGLMTAFSSGPGTDAYTTNILGFNDIYNGAEAIFTERLDRNSDQGFNNWSQVRRCNLIIEKVQAATGISEQDKTELIAEAKFLRAMTYFSVARRIGRIVWIDRVLAPDDDMMLPSTPNPTASYGYIIQDLEDAVAGLPTAKVAGRANKYVAAAMLTEVCLQALAYQNYPDAANISPNDPLLDKVISNAQLVLSGGYNLDSEYGAMFNDVNPNSSEIIYAIYRKAINTSLQSTTMQLMAPNFGNDQINQINGSPLLNSSQRIFEGWLMHGPANNLTNDYLVIDEQDPTVALPWNETSQYRAAVDEGVSIPETVIPRAAGETEIYNGQIKNGQAKTIWDLTNTGRDARWDETIISDSSSTFYGELYTTRVNGNANRWIKINNIAGHMSLSNLYWRKGMYTNVTPRLIFDAPTDYHNLVTRLGRVYLNLAEAYLLKGDLTNALSAMNQTRTVHGDLPPSKAGTPAQAWEDYKRERRVELVMENDYYWSLLRWGRYGGTANHGIAPGGTIPELTEVPEVMDISRDRKTFSVLRGAFFGSNNVRVFDPSRRYLMPIAQSYLDRNPNFGPQNPGW